MGAAGRLTSREWWRCAGLCVLVAVVALAAAAATARAAVAPVPAVTAKQLALMPLPAAEIGPRVAAFALTYDSGVRTNAKLLEDANHIYKGDLSVARRVSGYALEYEDPEAELYTSGRGLDAISTSVDLFADEASAEAGFALLLNEERSPDLAGLGTARVTDLPSPGVGDLSAAFLGSIVVQGFPRVDGAIVLFRSGTIVGTVEVTSGDGRAEVAFARQLAAKLLARVQGVARGSIGGAPVSLPAKRQAGPAKKGTPLAQLLLTSADVAGTVTDQSYEVDTTFDADTTYHRSFELAGGASRVTEMVFQFEHLGKAKATQRLLGLLLQSKELWRERLDDEAAGVGQKISSFAFVKVALPGVGVGTAAGHSIAICVGTGVAYVQSVSFRIGSRMIWLDVQSTEPLTVAALKRLAGVAAARAQGPA